MNLEEEVRKPTDELETTEHLVEPPQEQTAPLRENEQWWRNDDGSGEVQ